MIFFARFLAPFAFRQTANKFQNLPKENTRNVKKALGRTAEFLLDRIQTRTQRGKNADGKGFKPYTKDYREFRKERGYPVKPDLTFSGNMLSNMTQKHNNKQAILYFASKFENAKAVGNQVKNKRRFFSIGDKEQKTLINFFAKELFKLNKLT